MHLKVVKRDKHTIVNMTEDIVVLIMSLAYNTVGPQYAGVSDD